MDADRALIARLALRLFRLETSIESVLALLKYKGTITDQEFREVCRAVEIEQKESLRRESQSHDEALAELLQEFEGPEQ